MAAGSFGSSQPPAPAAPTAGNEVKTEPKVEPKEEKPEIPPPMPTKLEVDFSDLPMPAIPTYIPRPLEYPSGKTAWHWENEVRYISLFTYSHFFFDVFVY